MPELLVLCVDRDNDIGKKAGIETPVIGRSANIKAATKLGTVDPNDSDINAIYLAVKIFDELNAEKENSADIITLAGDEGSELDADKKISEQLDRILSEKKKKKSPYKGAILVTDGMQDDRILPIIESRIKIISVRQAIVKQSRQLESSYYVLKDFIYDILETPRMSRIFLGIPAIAFILYAIFGSAGIQLILGAIGIYLLIRGFSLEENVLGLYNELRTALTSKRASFFLYVLAIMVAITGLVKGYNFVVYEGLTRIINKTLAFVHIAIMYLYIAGLIGGIGRIIRYPEKNTVIMYVLYTGIGFSITLLVFKMSEFLLPPSESPMELIEFIILAFFVAAFTMLIERRFS